MYRGENWKRKKIKENTVATCFVAEILLLLLTKTSTTPKQSKANSKSVV